MLINCRFDAVKVAPNTKRYNFACNKLQNKKPHYVKIKHFKLRDILSWKISEIENLLLLCCLKQIAFFGSLDELKMHQLRKLITI